MAAHIFHSPHTPVDIPQLSITEFVFRGLRLVGARSVFTEVASGRQISGDEAIAKIQSLAAGFVVQGLQKGQVVAIMAPNCIDYFLVVHAVAYAGGVITLVNPSYTADELTYQLDQTQARFLVVARDQTTKAQEASQDTDVTKILFIGDATGDGASIWGIADVPLEQQASIEPHEDLAAIPFSSGTTGLPKGVMLTHRNLVANAAIWQALREIGPGDVTPTFLPFMHIFGLTLMQLVYPGAGGHVHLMPRFDLEQFLQLAQDTKAQRLFVVPPVAIALAKSPVVESHDLSSLREVGSGAAPLSVELGEQLASRLGCTFYQGYGMTELAGIGSSHTATSSSDTLGALLPGTEGRLVDPETGANRGVGEEGELWIRGTMVMKGYLGNPEATADTLTPEGWLRTGDIASIDANGLLRIHDRLKEMIKYKGFQVAPAEVEAALITHPKIADAAVVGVQDDEAGEAPMGFVVFAPGASLDLDEVQEHLRHRLAKYKVIKRMKVLDSIPKAASGKILRRELRKGHT